MYLLGAFYECLFVESIEDVVARGCLLELPCRVVLTMTTTVSRSR
jgi:hypothetical protein